MKQDRLSSLPVIILHDILSRLSHKCAARTSVLSKAWAETWSTFPILSFSDTKIIGKKRKNFIESEDYPQRKKKFCDYVERTMLKFRNNSMTIKKFKLKVYNFQDMPKDVDLWLKLAIESGVELLELCQHYNGCKREEIQDQCYILPMSVLEAKSLTKLELRVRIRVDITFRNHPIKFLSLKVLSLDDVCFRDEEALEHLISCCPLIEHITLRACFVYPTGEHLHHAKDSWMKSLSLYGLTRLKSVIIEGIQEVNVDSPCLESLSYVPGDLSAPLKIDYDRCINLRSLNLVLSKNTVITNKVFHDLFVKFPFLERLELGNCTMPDKINISTDRLNELVLDDCFNLKEVKIDAPNLLSFSYFELGNHVAKPIISFLRYSSQLVVSLAIHVEYHDLHIIREVIQNIKPQTIPTIIYLSIHETVAVELNPMVLQLSSPPPSIEYLVLQDVPSNEALYSSLVNILLSSCRPATIWLSLDPFQCSRVFIELLYKTLSGTNKDELNCSFGHTKCWWHDLKGARVVSSIKIGENIDLKTMLDTWQISGWGKSSLS